MIALTAAIGHSVLEASTEILKARVTSEMRRIVQSIPQRQLLTESAWLRHLIEHTLQSAGATTNRSGDSAAPEPPEPVARGARLYVRLRSDQLLLRERALHAPIYSVGNLAADFVTALPGTLEPHGRVETERERS